MEHDRARGLIQEMGQATEAYRADGEGSGKRWTRAAWDYSDLMHEHFGKEEQVVFRIADDVLSPEEQGAISVDFERLEREKIGPGRHQELEVVMKELIAQNRRR